MSLNGGSIMVRAADGGVNVHGLRIHEGPVQQAGNRSRRKARDGYGPHPQAEPEVKGP
jgi:hypothetical protein